MLLMSISLTGYEEQIIPDVLTAFENFWCKSLKWLPTWYSPADWYRFQGEMCILW